MSKTRRKQSKRCRADASARGVRIKQVGMRDDVSAGKMGKKAQSTFALTSGAGRLDLASVAPSSATGARDWRDLRKARAADALLGQVVPVPVAPTPTGTHAGVDTVTPAPRPDAPAPTARELADALHAAEARQVVRECGGIVPLLLALNVSGNLPG